MPERSPKGFLPSLFDFSFSSFIATRLVKLLYGLAMVGIALAAVSMVVGAFQEGLLAGLFMLLIGAPLATLFMLVYARIVAELMIVVFRISENIQRIAGPGGPGSERA
jgi:hypothetical protein